jgi:hypothetical protein
LALCISCVIPHFDILLDVSDDSTFTSALPCFPLLFKNK